MIAIACEERAGEPSGRSFEAAAATADRALRLEAARAASIDTSNEQFNDWLNRGARRPAHDDHRDPRPARTPMPASPGSARRSAATGSSPPWSASGSARRSPAGVLAYPGRDPGRRGHPRAGRRAGQDPPRDPQRARWPCSERCRSAATTAASTPRRCSCMLAGAYFERTGDRAFIESTLAEHRARPWPGSTATATATATGSSSTAAARRNGLVHQGGRTRSDAVFHADGRLAPRARSRLCEVQGYVYAAKRPAPPAGRRPRRRADVPTELDAPGRGAPRAVRSGLLVRGPGHLCAGARRREAALPGADLERRPAACSPASPRPSARPRVARRCLAPGHVLRLGGPDARRPRGPLQPDVVPQRLRLAARQRPDRARAGPLRLQRGAAGPDRPVRHRPLRRPAPPAGAVLRLRPAAARQGPTLYPVACSPQAWAAALRLPAPPGVPRPRVRFRDGPGLLPASVHAGLSGPGSSFAR